jgi:HAD superfamily hydrolase (TIGR01509 family)
LLTLVSTAIGNHATVMKGAIDMVQLARKVAPIAVASNSPRRLLNLALERGGFADTFSISLAVEDVRCPKPAPDIYLEACRRLGARPEQTLAFEDSMTGVRSARAAGVKVVCIPTLQGLEYPADAIFPSLDDERLVSWLVRSAASF